MTISPSSTNFLADNFNSAATTSGKYRVKGFPDFDSKDTFLPSRNARQRKPSHLGSYCQLSPAGNSDAGRASMGRYFLLMGKVIHLRQAPRINLCAAHSNLIQMRKQIGWIAVNAIGARALQFIFPESARQQTYAESMRTLRGKQVPHTVSHDHALRHISSQL